jgi:hypothetical protein
MISRVGFADLNIALSSFTCFASCGIIRVSGLGLVIDGQNIGLALSKSRPCSEAPSYPPPVLSLVRPMNKRGTLYRTRLAQAYIRIRNTMVAKITCDTLGLYLNFGNRGKIGSCEPHQSKAMLAPMYELGNQP